MAVRKSKNPTKDGRCWEFLTYYTTINGERKLKHSKLFKTQKEAKDAEREFLNTFDISDSFSCNKTLKNEFEDYMHNECEIKNKESSCYNYESIFYNNIIPYFDNGDKQMIKITLKDIEKWKNTINDKDYSMKHKKRIYVVFSNIFGYAVKIGDVKENYVKRVGNFISRNDEVKIEKEIRYQTVKEFNNFMSVVDDIEWKAFFNFTFWHGCRKGEMQALTWKDINFNKKMVTIDKTFSDKVRGGGTKITNTKNRRSRKIDLAEQSIDVLLELKNTYKQLESFHEDWFVFGGIRYLPKTTIDNNFNKYYNKLEQTSNEDINRLTHHEFGRHSHASLLLELGATTYDIALRLGDTEEVIRQTYVHPYMDQRSAKMRNLLNSDILK